MQPLDSECLGSWAQKHLSVVCEIDVLAPDGCSALERSEQIGAGQAFWQIGLANCQLNTSLPAGTMVAVPFSVIYPGRPDLKATVNRTILIVCPQGAEQQACHLMLCPTHLGRTQQTIWQTQIIPWLLTDGCAVRHAGSLLSLCVLRRQDIQLQWHLPGGALLHSQHTPTCSPAVSAVHS